MNELAIPKDRDVLVKFFVLTTFIVFFVPQLFAVTELRELKKRGPKIRVRVATKQKEVVISGTDLKRKMFISGKEKSYSGKMGVKFNCRNLKKRLRRSEHSIPLATMTSQTGLITVKRTKFRGTLTILAASDRRSCDVINEIPLDSYISSLLSKEMNASWPQEALKAQAVAARTYAIHKMESGQVSKELGHEAFYDLESSEKHQVGGSFFDATRNTDKAARSTRGEILMLGSGKITPAFFHAQCGGKTIKPGDVWENKISGYNSKPCPYCQTSKKGFWNAALSKKRVRDFMVWILERTPSSDLIGINLDEGILIAPDSKDKLDLRIYIGDALIVVSKVMLRKYFGRTTILSNRFIASVDSKGALQIKGKGHGHGVGMCQLGALYLAKQGWNYKKILAYYFPNHRIKKVY